MSTKKVNSGKWFSYTMPSVILEIETIVGIVQYNQTSHEMCDAIKQNIHQAILHTSISSGL
jgi:hypothetical protein